ncbi:MAG: inositol monophosphatase family protein, partial [Thermomicrobiales bacterium]
AAVGHGAWIDAGDGWRRVTFDVGGRRPIVATSHWFGAPENLGMVSEIAGAIGGELAPSTRIGLTPRQFLEGDAMDVLLGFRLGVGQFMAHEWDAATADLFLTEAGGIVTDLHGRVPRYNQRAPQLDRGLVVAIDRDLHSRALQETRRALETAGLDQSWS